MVDDVADPAAGRPLSRTALREQRLKPAPGQAPAQKVWSRRRREYIELFDPALCVPMAPVRALSAAQAEALAAGRENRRMFTCQCGASVERRFSSHGQCAGCEEAEQGRVVLNTLVRPQRRTIWPEAEAIHGITPEAVAQAPELATVVPTLLDALRSADALVIYNSAFDLGFLPPEVRAEASRRARCAMTAYALWRGDWMPSGGEYRFHRLEAAADAAGHQWSGAAHRALADALATRDVWRWLQAQTI